MGRAEDGICSVELRLCYILAVVTASIVLSQVGEGGVVLTAEAAIRSRAPTRRVSGII
jgi:hypothetical protein